MKTQYYHNNLLTTYHRHSLWAKYTLIITGLLTCIGLYLNLEKYKQATATTFIYKSGASILIACPTKTLKQ